MESLYSEFREVDNLVAHNSMRVLKAFQNAGVGSHVKPSLSEARCFLINICHLFAA